MRSSDRFRAIKKRRGLGSRLLIGFGLVVIILACVGGTLTGLLYYQGHQKPPADATYVAMGSSFAAGPGVGKRVPGGPFLCMRSASNYAQLVAKAEGLVLADVSCSGATTIHVLDGGQYWQPAQLDAVTDQTRLVTVTIGGNDLAYIGNMVAEACVHDPHAITFWWRASGICKSSKLGKTDAEFDAVRRHLARIIAEIRRRAPDARVLLVDYITVAPAEGSCTSLALTPAEADGARHIADRLAAITAAAAAEGNAELIRWSAASQGHDLCAADPWVQPFTDRGGPPPKGTVFFHPNQAGMEAAARLIIDALAQKPLPTPKHEG